MTELEQNVRVLDRFFREEIGWDSGQPPWLFVQMGDLFGPIGLPDDIWRGRTPGAVMEFLASGVVPMLLGVPTIGEETPVVGQPSALVFTSEAYALQVEDMEEFDTFVRPLAEAGRIEDHPLRLEVRHYLAVTDQRELLLWCRYRQDEEAELTRLPEGETVGEVTRGLVALMDAFRAENDRMN